MFWVVGIHSLKFYVILVFFLLKQLKKLNSFTTRYHSTLVSSQPSMFITVLLFLHALHLEWSPCEVIRVTPY